MSRGRKVWLNTRSRVEHTIVFVPGLGDDEWKMRLVFGLWRRRGFIPIVYNMHWRDGGHFENKLQNLLQVVDKNLKKGKVSLIGTSAGGSAVANVLLARKDKIMSVVNVCGRLRRGLRMGLRSFESMTKTSVAFAESVAQFEDHEFVLTAQDRKKILTIHPLFDELVPPETTMIEGATNLVIPSIEHGLSIVIAITLWSGRIARFLRSGKLSI